LYYFHQFPLYFLVSGLVVVLMAQLILGLGIALFLFHWWSVLAELIAQLLEWALWFNNAFVYWVRALPGHLLSGVWIGGVLFMLLFASLFLFARFWANRRPAFLLSSMAVLLVGLGTQAYMKYEQHQQRGWRVYQQYKASVIDAFDGTKRYTLSTLSDNDPALVWSAKPHRERSGVMPYDSLATPLHWYNGHPVYGFYDQRLLLIDKDWQPDNAVVNKLVVDLVVFRQSPRVELATISQWVDSKYWIADGSNYPSYVSRWEGEALDMKLNWHYTARDGAFVNDF